MVSLSSLLCNESVMNRSFLHSLANSPAIPQVPCMPACGHVLQMADELASANIPRAVERESAACVARNVKCVTGGHVDEIRRKRKLIKYGNITKLYG
jgi:hypothetical protein